MSKDEKLNKEVVNERESVWLKAFTDAGYEVKMDNKHCNMTIKGLGMSIALQKTNTVPYITFSTDEQLEGLNKIFSVKKYGYTVAMPAKKSDKGDSRFRAVSGRNNNELELALEVVAKVKELKDKEKRVKEAEKAKTAKEAEKAKAEAKAKKETEQKAK